MAWPTGCPFGMKICSGKECIHYTECMMFKTTTDDMEAKDENIFRGGKMKPLTDRICPLARGADRYCVGEKCVCYYTYEVYNSRGDFVREKCSYLNCYHDDRMMQSDYDRLEVNSKVRRI